uniref:Uncharacterized protein n=1 Tax=Ananas comosus var. bracteatus TaxID=296719 RepID=A0A6V7QHF9_ANACO|nr:unnamed protein product [Ananas comosus var. bracteatus]
MSAGSAWPAALIHSRLPRRQSSLSAGLRPSYPRVCAARASLPNATAASRRRPTRALTSPHQPHLPAAGSSAAWPPPAVPELPMVRWGQFLLNFVSLVRSPKWPAVLRSVSTAYGTSRPANRLLKFGVIDAIFMLLCSDPWRKLSLHQRVIFHLGLLVLGLCYT